MLRTDNLNLDIDLDNTLAEGIDLNKTRVDRLIELAELGDQTDIALVYLLVGVGAANAAGKGTKSSNAGAEGIDHRTVPVVGVGVLVDNLSIALLQILLARTLDRHGSRSTEARAGRGAIAVARVRHLPCRSRAALSMRVHLD